jgi:hypothetical protein
MQREYSPDAAVRKEQAKARVKAQKEEQLREAREAATARILSGDTSKKKAAAKVQKQQEVRGTGWRGAIYAGCCAAAAHACLPADAMMPCWVRARSRAGAASRAAGCHGADAGLRTHQARPGGRRYRVPAGRRAVLGSGVSAHNERKQT